MKLGFYSSLKYSGAVPTTPYSTTTENAEFVGMPLVANTSPQERIQTASWLVTAGADDLYIIPIITSTEPDTYVGMDVMYVPAGLSKEITSVDIKGIKILNNLGAEYLIEVLKV